jgi:hypothetical protein
MQKCITIDANELQIFFIEIPIPSLVNQIFLSVNFIFSDGLYYYYYYYYYYVSLVPLAYESLC